MVCEIYVLWVGQVAVEMEQLIPAKKQSGLWPAGKNQIVLSALVLLFDLNKLKQWSKSQQSDRIALRHRLFSSVFSIYAKIGWWLHRQVVA